MRRRKFLLTSGSTMLGGVSLGSIQNPVIGVDFEISGSTDGKQGDVDLVIVEFTNFEVTPRYLDDRQELDMRIELEIEGHGEVTITASDISFSNGETITRAKIQNRSNTNLDSINIDGLDISDTEITGNVTIIIDQPDILEKKYQQSFTIQIGNTILADEFLGSKGSSLGNEYLISQGIRKSRNTDNTTFSFQKNGNSSMDMSHDGSGGSNTFGEIASDTNSLSNNEWVVNMYGQSWSYNSQQNNYRTGVVDRTNRGNFCEFMETESPGVNPRVAGNNANSSYSSNDVSFNGGKKYNWSFQMNNGTITVYKDGTEVFSKTGFPSGEYVWFVMNENDSDTSAQETHLLDKLEIIK